MEGTRRSARAAEGNLKGKSYVRQFGERARVDSGLRVLPDIVSCTTYGMKGTLSEMELVTLHQRAQTALQHKAQRGALFASVAVGYVKVGREGIAMDPDQRIREAISLVFRKFTELRSIRQVHLWFAEKALELPAASYGPTGREIIWKPPSCRTISGLLKNPVYAGAYAWGRTTSRVHMDNGRKRVLHGVRLEAGDWKVLIYDHHDGYITWADYERNQRLIADNAVVNKGAATRGATRAGKALLTGLLRCGHCGRKLQVAYRNTHAPRYQCRGTDSRDGKRCITFTTERVDEVVSAAVLRALQPLGVEAALHAIDNQGREADDGKRQAELMLEEARFRADQARRRYEAVDPDNRLVASNLEQAWNVCLQTLEERKGNLADLRGGLRKVLTAEERSAFLNLGARLEQAWSHDRATAVTRKHIVRTVLEEIIVTVDGNQIGLRLHWKGGDHTKLTVRKNRHGHTRWTVDTDTELLIRELARLMSDRSIAAHLNRGGRRTGRNNNWNVVRVRSFRHKRGIGVYREGERQERDELMVHEAAERLSVSESRVRHLIRRGIIPARQVCKGAPLVIAGKDLDLPETGTLQEGRIPLTTNPDQQPLDL